MSQDEASSPPRPRRSPLRWWVCGLLFLATVLNYMDRMALNQTALRIKMSLGINDFDYSLLESIFSFAFAFGAITTGYIVDRANVRWVYPLMVLGWSVAGVLTGFATTFWALLACRMMLGFFEAGNWPCGIRTTRTVLPPEERSFGNSLFQSGTALGAVLTPLLIPVLLLWVDPFEPQRNATMAAVGGSYAAVSDAPTNTWQYPFRIIGSLGVVWIVLWFVTVPGRLVRTKPAPVNIANPASTGRFTDVFRDPRYWLLLGMVIAINITWHGYRTWLPLFLQTQRDFSEAEMNGFMWRYYLAADVGSWTIGLLSLALAKYFVSVHGSRLIAFAICAGLALLTLTVPFLHEKWALKLILLLLAFGALGLFPTYFALTQELSSKHQGKVTGSLGASAHLSLAAIYPIEGWIVTATKSYELVLTMIGIVPMVVFVAMLWIWPPSRVFEATEQQT